MRRTGWWKAWEAVGDNAARLVGVVTIVGLLVTAGSSLLASRLDLSASSIIVIALSGALLTLIVAVLVLLFALRRSRAYARTLNVLFKETFVVLDSLLITRCGSRSLDAQAKLTSCLDFLLLFARDHVAPGKDKVVSFLGYDSAQDCFTLVAQCPSQSTSGAVVSKMTKDNCLAGRAIGDGKLKHYGDVASDEAKNGGFNNDLGRSLHGSVVEIPVFGHDDQPLGVLDCYCEARFAFATGDVELLQLLASKIRLTYTMFLPPGQTISSRGRDAAVVDRSGV